MIGLGKIMKIYDLQEEQKITQIKRMRKAIEFMHRAAREYEIVGLHVESISLDIIIQRRQTELDSYVSEHFPVSFNKNWNKDLGRRS